MNSKSGVQTKSNTVAKAGIWYTVCNFLFKGMAFITTPIFARLMSKEELGSFSNYSSWISILLVVTSFDLAQSVIRSKLEHEDDMDCYIWSILVFSTISTLICYGIVLLFPTFFCNIFNVNIKYIHIMFAYLLTAPAYSMLITKHRAFYKYKMFVLLTGIALISSTIFSLFLVFMMTDKLAGRIYGYYLPYVLMGAMIYIYLAMKGKRVKIEYWKYACVICLPLVPHVLSMYLLSSSDKIIITKLCGAEYTAIYSIAYSCYHIVTILFDSMNKAWAPWLLESLHKEKYEEIRKSSMIYIGIFEVLAIGILLVVPEVIWILGGKEYAGAIYCLPPLITSCVFQFIYTMYVNIEFYEKKTIGVALATMVATGINLALNFILIPISPENGYIIAAYTTLAGYIVLFIMHYFMVKRLGMDHVYNTKNIVIILLATLLISLVANVLYKVVLIRYTIVLIYGLGVLFIIFKKKDVLKNLIKN